MTYDPTTLPAFLGLDQMPPIRTDLANLGSASPIQEFSDRTLPPSRPYTCMPACSYTSQARHRGIGGKFSVVADTRRTRRAGVLGLWGRLYGPCHPHLTSPPSAAKTRHAIVRNLHTVPHFHRAGVTEAGRSFLALLQFGKSDVSSLHGGTIFVKRRNRS